jgi:hypothetical protein
MGFEQNRGYTDVLGEIATAPSGAAQWATAQIGATGFFINWLQAGQNDYFQLKSQVDHRFGKAQPVADVHVHYTLSAVPAAGQTVNLELAYCWVPINQPIPLIGAWGTATPVLTFLGTEAAQAHYVFALLPGGITVPANQTYSSILFIKCTRRSQGVGADTYAGNFGLLYVDAHIQADRVGSKNYNTD